MPRALREENAIKRIAGSITASNSIARSSVLGALEIIEATGRKSRKTEWFASSLVSL